MNKPVEFTFDEYKEAVSVFASEEASINAHQKLVLAEVLKRDLARREKIYKKRQEKLDTLKSDNHTEDQVSDVAQDNDSSPATPPQNHSRESATDSESESNIIDPDSKPKRNSKNADVVIKHELGERTDNSCRKCSGGLHKDKDRVQIHITAPVMFRRERHECESYRCSSCGYVEVANPGFDKNNLIGEFSPEATAALVTYHYYLGMPFKRLETMLGYFSKNYKASSLWDVCSEASDRLSPLFLALWIYAKENATSMRIDDSGAKILSLQRKIQTGVLSKKRIGINTTGMYFELKNKTPVSLFVTGLQHAGEKQPPRGL